MKASSPNSEHSMVFLAGGDFAMGSVDGYPEEAPVRTVSVAPFLLDSTPVTNAQFAAFVDATGYVTFAERAPNSSDYPGISDDLRAPGSIVFVSPQPGSGPLSAELWWRYVLGANWRQPYGTEADVQASPEHPVVHVVLEDCLAYAAWCGKRLPTEPELEFAAQGGRPAAKYAWGPHLLPDGGQRANFWRTGFPYRHPERSGPPYTTPVTAYPENDFGLYDLIGNVWEWTTTDADDANATPRCCAPERQRAHAMKVLKGGSHLCAPNWCRRYRPAARWFQPTDTSTSHVGFRCARDAPISKKCA
jgi:formylglycine-generating enzyme required for sulfatase activity